MAEGRRTERIALTVLVLLGFLGLYLWQVPASQEACLEQAGASHQACREAAARARITMSEYGYGTTQGGRISDAAREGKLKECARAHALAAQGCERRFLSD